MKAVVELLMGLFGFGKTKKMELQPLRNVARNRTTKDVQRDQENITPQEIAVFVNRPRRK